MSRICLVVPELDFGGVETCVLQQVELMRDEDIEVVTFWRAGRTAERIRSLGVRVVVLDENPGIRRPRATWALARHFARTKPRVVHARIGEAMLHAALAGQLAGVPRVIVEEVGIPQRSRMSALAFRAVYGAADVIVGVSPSTCRWLVSAGAPARKVCMLYNSVPSGFLLAPMAAMVGPSIHFVTAGRLVPVKNHEMLLRSFADMVCKMPEARLTIAGEGPLYAHLQSVVIDLGLLGVVNLPGYVDDVRALLGTADVFVLPSITEGFGLALVEAMAMGLPSLASIGTGAAECLLADQPDCVLPASSQAAWSAGMLRAGRMSGAHRRALGASNRSFIHSRFSSQAWVTELQRIYADEK